MGSLFIYLFFWTFLPNFVSNGNCLVLIWNGVLIYSMVTFLKRYNDKHICALDYFIIILKLTKSYSMFKLKLRAFISWHAFCWIWYTYKYINITGNRLIGSSHDKAVPELYIVTFRMWCLGGNNTKEIAINVKFKDCWR